ANYRFKSANTSILVEVFFNDIRNFMYLEATGTEQTIRGAFPVWEHKKTNANLFGADFSLTQNIGSHFILKNISSFIRGKDIKNDRNLIDIPSAKTLNSIGYTLEKWYDFSAVIESEYVFRQKLFPNNNFETYIPTTDTTVLVDVSTTPSSYHLLNFNSDATFKLSEKTNLTVGLTVTNILNINYRENLNRLRFFADDLGRNYTLQLKLNY
ncbi:TonB-dependent receptor, partial [Polaribacter sp.]|nr:TonB-dependent receptor [Polaribacter sp.]